MDHRDRTLLGKRKELQMSNKNDLTLDAAAFIDGLGARSELERQIRSDLAQIIATVGLLKCVVAIVSDNLALKAAVVLFDSTDIGLQFHEGGHAGYTMIASVPDLQSDAWKPFQGKFTAAEALPDRAVAVAYFVEHLESGSGLALARDGRLAGWSHNPELIDLVGDLLQQPGLLRRGPRRSSSQESGKRSL
jgi:hypothetical protein